MGMLQHIVSCTDYIDSISLRLTCKKLETASSNAFAAAYLHELTCFVINRGRIKRALNITSSDRLGCKVRTLTLTFDVYEGRTFQLAPGRPGTYYTPYEDLRRVAVKEQI